MAGFDPVGKTKGGLDVLAISPEAFPAGSTSKNERGR